MQSVKQFILVFIVLVFIYKFSNVCPEYKGENFPEHYLEPDGQIPSDSDLDIYLDKIDKITNYMNANVNDTDANQAVGGFLSTAILRRTLLDYGHKLEKHRDMLKAIIFNISNVLSHYNYINRKKRWEDLEYRISRILKDDTSNMHSLGTFKRDTMKKWILKFAPINEFLASMDLLSLPKEKYVQLVEATDSIYFITAHDSDRCLSRLIENMDPVNATVLQPCKLDKFCRERMFVSPSVAYSISHRLLNSMMYMHNRRCFHYSPAFDNTHMEMLCAAMYREVVYIARRGYFARDLFLEHIGLCGQLGFEEFFRRHWFHKAASWIDEGGCMQEFGNFEINRTKLMLAQAKNPKEVKKMQKLLDDLLDDDCHHHQMAVAMLMLANGVRHAAHFKDSSVVDV